ncbi:MAG TPA: NADH:flavin oxidoreductase [Planctomycetaceae bacterium]|jgi:2,4-dienoyl-CoA reductase-like NADH-dependent reductase (Old Yellow Enzyme family)|nr:NADH:flavin oxidoreductase [Planctomycetaceae bacterium]
MARYFRYKTAEALMADAAHLGEELSLTDRSEALFQSIAIGGKRCGNRLAIQPMEGCDGTQDGRPDELTFRRYMRFGGGGAKLIWGEATAVSDEGRANPRQLWLCDHTASAIEDMLARCRRSHCEAFGNDNDLLIGLQLTHSGRYGYRRTSLVSHDPLRDPLTVDNASGRRVDDSFALLSDGELERIADEYVAAAHLAAKVGVDFVDIKQCHGYLLSELLAARNRPGKFGGSLENRTRLVRQIVARIRSEIPSLSVATRFNAYDGIPYRRSQAGGVGEPVPHDLPLQNAFGTDPHDHRVEDLAEPVQLAVWLREAGVRLLNVTAGNPYVNPHVVRPADYPPVDGYEPPEHPLFGVLRHFRLARAIQAAVPDVPVVGSGYSWLQEFAMQAAAANVADGSVAIVGLGRATLAQPDFARNLQERGRLDHLRTCRTFSYCTNLMRNRDHPQGQSPTGCPPFDKEVYGPLWKELQRKLNVAEPAEESTS